MNREDWRKIRDLLGEAMHTGFRKGIDNEQAMQIHRLIRDMGEDWGAYTDWVFYALYYSIEGKDPPADLACQKC